MKYHLSQFTENHSLKLILSVTPIPHHSSQTPSTSSRPPSNIRSHSENPKAAHIPQPDVDALNQYLTPLLGQNPDPNHAAASKFDQPSLKNCDSYLGTYNDKNSSSATTRLTISPHATQRQRTAKLFAHTGEQILLPLIKYCRSPPSSHLSSFTRPHLPN